jgi:hypothetical protein
VIDSPYFYNEIAAKHGGKDVYDALMERFKVNEDPGEVRDLICAMCCNKIPELHKDVTFRTRFKSFFELFFGRGGGSEILLNSVFFFCF